MYSKDKKRITIEASMKFRDKIRTTISNLEDLGFVGIFPNLDNSDENRDIALTMGEKHQLAIDHYEAIRNSDAVYFILPKGYMGTSCKLELGYSFALEKPIYFSEKTGDIGLDSYPKRIISLDNLKEFKNELSD